MKKALLVLLTLAMVFSYGCFGEKQAEKAVVQNETAKLSTKDKLSRILADYKTNTVNYKRATSDNVLDGLYVETNGETFYYEYEIISGLSLEKVMVLINNIEKTPSKTYVVIGNKYVSFDNYTGIESVANNTTSVLPLTKQVFSVKEKKMLQVNGVKTIVEVISSVQSNFLANVNILGVKFKKQSIKINLTTTAGIAKIKLEVLTGKVTPQEIVITGSALTTEQTIYVDSADEVTLKPVKTDGTLAGNVNVVSVGTTEIEVTTGGYVVVPSGSVSTQYGNIVVGNDFYISKYEITQAQFQSIMGYNPATFTGASRVNNPVETLTWYDAVAYCNKLSEKEGLDLHYTITNIEKSGNNIIKATVTTTEGIGYRLPSYNEWKYAEKGGKNGLGYKYSGSNIAADVSWFNLNSTGTTHSVGTKKANELGIYDMSGNVKEMTEEKYNLEYPIASGGSFDSEQYGLTTITSISISAKDETVGFRPVLTKYTSVLTVAINTTNATIQVDDSLVLSAVITPLNATRQKVEWTSSNTTIAAIDSNGKVTAGKTTGTAIITVTTVDGAKKATCKITVVPVVITGVAIYPTERTAANTVTTVSIGVNTTFALSASVTPTNAVNKNVTWKSSNTTAASVDGAGKVTAGATTGTAIITATTADGGITTTCTIVVIVPPTANYATVVKAGTTSSTNGTITVENDFYIGKYEVMQGEYKSLMGYNPSYFTGANVIYNPVEQVTWYDAVAFCNAKSVADGLTPFYTITNIVTTHSSISSASVVEATSGEGLKGWRLPTQIEWEYAARGGVKGNGYSYSGSENSTEVAWFVDNSNTNVNTDVVGTHIAGTKKANDLGLYDMSGNVGEWTSGTYNGYKRVINGGSWSESEGSCDVTSWNFDTPIAKNNKTGFRLVRNF